MKVIEKHLLYLYGSETAVMLPLSAKVVYIGEQHGSLYMWVETTPGEQLFTRGYRVFNTGNSIDDSVGMEITYVGSAIMEGGSFTAHVYQTKAVEWDQ